MTENFELLIFKSKILVLHVYGSHVNGDIIFYFVHGTSYNVGICADYIITRIGRKVYIMKHMKLVAALIVCKSFLVSELMVDSL